MNTIPADLLNKYVAFIQGLCDTEQKLRLAGYPNLANDPKYVAESRNTITVEPGRRYIKLVSNRQGGRSVHSFLDVTNGDILRAAGWKKPFHSTVNSASDARGNIFDRASWAAAVNAYGAAYIR